VLAHLEHKYIPEEVNVVCSLSNIIQLIKAFDFSNIVIASS
jgi:hypothetical protein